MSELVSFFQDVDIIVDEDVGSQAVETYSTPHYHLVVIAKNS